MIGGIQHEFRQRDNILNALCQQWYMQRKFIQTMEQVFPETSFGYRLLQVLIGSSYQTDVRLNLLFTATGR